MAQSMSQFLLEVFLVLCKMTFFIVEAMVKSVIPSKYLKKDVKGQKVLITGAGSGMGKIMARRFVELGCDVVLWDINGNALESMVGDFESRVACRAYTVDLSSREQIYQTADKVKKEFGTIDILVNNAGIVTGRTFMDCPDDLIMKTMDVNAMAHFWTTKAFLPAMLSKNSGHIVSIASSAGLFGVAGLADYCASKYAAVGFSESIQNEVVAMGKTGVNTTVVCPFFINTGMFDGVKLRYPRLTPILEPEDAVDRIMTAVLCNKTMLIMPPFTASAYVMRGILPVKAGYVLQSFLGVNKSMANFIGRNNTTSKKD